MKRLIGCTAVLCLLALTVGCGGTSSGTLAYVSNSTGNSFTVFNVNTDGTLSTSSISPQNTPKSPKILVFSPSGQWAFFLDAAGANVYVYTRAGNGTLATLAYILQLTNGPASSLAVSNDNQFLYVAGAQPQAQLTVISILSNGQLFPLQTVNAGYAISQLAMSPAGVLYGLAPSAVLSFTFGPTGGNTSVNPFFVGSDLSFMILSANGSFMYVLSHTDVDPIYPNPGTNGTGPSPSIYALTTTSTGILSSMPNSPFHENPYQLSPYPFPANPVGGATSSDSRFLYIANLGSGNGGFVSVFSISAIGGLLGQLTEVPGVPTFVGGVAVSSSASPYPCGCSPTFLAVAKANNGLYLLSPTAIFQFAIQQNIGVLRAFQPPSVPVSNNPTWITIR